MSIENATIAQALPGWPSTETAGALGRQAWVCECPHPHQNDPDPSLIRTSMLEDTFGQSS